MASYSVIQIAEKLNTNPETVRRWIRQGKLKSIQTSKKEGNQISEEDLNAFLRSEPKYQNAMFSSACKISGLSETSESSAFWAGFIYSFLQGKERGTILSAKDLGQFHENYEYLLKCKLADLERKEKKLRDQINQLQEEQRQLREIEKSLCSRSNKEDTMSIFYIPSESMEVQGKADAIYKKYGKEWNVKPLGAGNGNFLLTKSSDVLVNGKSYRKAILEYYHKSKLTKALFNKFRSDLESGTIKLA